MPSHISTPISYLIIFSSASSILIALLHFLSHYTPYILNTNSLSSYHHTFPSGSVTKPLKLAHASWIVLFHCRQLHSLGSLVHYTPIRYCSVYQQSKNRFHQDNKPNKATLPSCPCGSSAASNLDDFEDSHLVQQVLLTT